jgi:hypothetical protein
MAYLVQQHLAVAYQSRKLARLRRQGRVSQKSISDGGRADTWGLERLPMAWARCYATPERSTATLTTLTTLTLSHTMLSVGRWY